jgi:hypothetical protein
MKKILSITSGQIGGLISGIASSLTGLSDLMSADSKRQESDSYFQKAFDYIPEEVSPELLSSKEEVKRKRRGYESGSNLTFIEDEIADMLSTGAVGVSNLAGGNTGAAISAMLGLSDGALDNYNKVLAQGQDLSLQALTAETKLNSDIVNRKDGIDKMKADFNVMRANQAYVEGASQQKSGMENILGGIATISDMDFEKLNPLEA